MALRFVAESEDRIQRFPLAEGENLLGSSPDCAIRLRHPSVSRRHAMIYVDRGRVDIEDVGSRNGTRLEGRRVGPRQPLPPGRGLLLGSVTGWLEEVSDKDLEAAVVFPGARPEESQEDRMGPASTAGMGSLRGFTLDCLPELLGRLAAGGHLVPMAQAVGDSLFRSLPCLWVEIASRDGGVLFRAQRDENIDVKGSEAAAENDTVAVRASFLHPAHVKSYSRLLDVGGLLVRLADTGEASGVIGLGDRPPPLPDPPTVVPEMLKIYTDAGRVAKGDVSVLIRGDSGTGKEVLARYLHAASRRARKAFITLNCAALPRDLLESELFGIERGVATGVDPRPGKFEQAHGGTLFLDEIGDMALETQARILRVLEEGEVYRLGAREPRPADVRVVAATNRDLELLQRDGSFRSDLYHRVADWTVTLPPLPERRADIPNLAAYFLAEEGRRRGIAVGGISRRAMELLEAYDWPGNVRQLEREMARAVLFLEDGELLESARLQDTIRQAGKAPASLKEKLEAVERREIERALAHHDGNVSAAAKELQLGLSTLYRRMRELGIENEG